MNPTTIFLALTGLTTLLALSAEDAAGFKDLTASAESGDPAAQVALAIRYRDGKGVAKDNALAMQWAHRAADRGDSAAMDFVGHAYLRGAIVERRPEIAFGYFKAAAGESAQAAFNLGQCYFGAQGTEQDIPKALEWWKKAADKGHAVAAATAAMAYLSGEGVAPDPVQARRLAERAAELNDPSGLVVLGELQFQAGELDAAKANWSKASKLLPTGATGHPAQPSASASAQQGADLLKLIDYRQRKGEPGKFAFVQMPHIQQGPLQSSRRHSRPATHHRRRPQELLALRPLRRTLQGRALPASLRHCKAVMANPA
jgi:TPR repeat protein